jgi:hypothetical protein
LPSVCGRDLLFPLFFYSCIFPDDYYYYFKYKLQNKAYWYMVMKELQDEETQKNGAVILVWNTGPNRRGFEEASFVKSSLSQRGGLPFKSNAYHFMYDNSLVIPLAALFSLFLKTTHRNRFRHHYFGTYTVGRPQM